MAKKILISILVILLSLMIGFFAGMVVQNEGFDGLFDFIRTGEKEEEPTALEGQIVTVGINTANVFEKPEPGSAVIYSMSNYETALCVEETDEWLKLEIIEGVYGYAHANLFTLASASDIANDTTPKEPVEAKSTYVTPTVNVLDIYKDATTDADIVATVEYGAVLEMVEKGEAWSKVKTLDGIEGYVLTTDVETTEYDPDALVVKVTNSFVNLRAEADSDSDKLGSLNRGETAEYLGEEGDFYKIRTEDGTECYVSKDYTELVNTSMQPVEDDTEE